MMVSIMEEPTDKPHGPHDEPPTLTPPPWSRSSQRFPQESHLTFMINQQPEASSVVSIMEDPLEEHQEGMRCLAARTSLPDVFSIL